MRFVRFNQKHLGLSTNDGIVDLTDRLGLGTINPLVECINGDYNASEYVDAEPGYDRNEIEIKPPIKCPSKVITAPPNCENHIEEAIADKDITTNEWFSIEGKGYFLEAPSGVVELDHGIELPFDDRQVNHEIELAFVMGEDTKSVDSDEAQNNVFGYTILLDISVCDDQDRLNRKSYDTFTVVGPDVVASNEVDNPQDLDIQLDLSGETCQDTNTSNMIYVCADIVQYASINTTPETGDTAATGTSEGVSEFGDGDIVEAKIENVGSMTVDVTRRDLSFADVSIQKGGQ